MSTFKSTNLQNAVYDYALYGYMNDAVISQNGRTIFVAMPNGIHVIPVSAFVPVN